MPPGRLTILANASKAIAGSVWWGELDTQNVQHGADWVTSHRDTSRHHSCSRCSLFGYDSDHQFPSLRAAGHGLGYGIYAAFAVLSFVFVRWVVTETNGRQLEAMPEQITVPPATRVLRDRPQFEG
jgi:hypothetical protein